MPAAVASKHGDDDSTSDRPLFYESRRGDENNLRYGGLHRGDVPRYRRLGEGRVVGLNEGLRITRETAYSGRGVEVAPLNRFRVRGVISSSQKERPRLTLSSPRRRATPTRPRSGTSPTRTPSASSCTRARRLLALSAKPRRPRLPQIPSPARQNMTTTQTLSVSSATHDGREARTA